MLKKSKKIAGYFGGLYSPDLTLPDHEYHSIVIRKLNEYERNRDFEHLEHNEVPSIEEVENVINKAGYTATPVACGWAGAIF